MGGGKGRSESVWLCSAQGVKGRELVGGDGRAGAIPGNATPEELVGVEGGVRIPAKEERIS